MRSEFIVMNTVFHKAGIASPFHVLNASAEREDKIENVLSMRTFDEMKPERPRRAER